MKRKYEIKSARDHYAAALCRLLLVVTCCAGTAARAADVWQPAKGPLMTRWAAEVSSENALPEYPRPTMTRPEWRNLNGLWDYAITAKSAEQRPAAWDGKILVPFPIESALSGVMRPLKPDQRLWYRRKFSIPEKWAGQRVLLHFGAVDWETAVFLNGRNLGSHRGGYDAFVYDITDALKKDATQELVVGVLDPTDAGWQLRGKQTLHPGGAAYTACSGIWQTVWLEPVPRTSVESLHAVTDVTTGVLKLTVNARTPVQATEVTVTVSEGGKAIATAGGKLGSELTKGVRDNLAWYKARLIWVSTDITIPMKSARVWTPDSPVLYDLTVQLKGADGAIADTVQSYVGLRSIVVGKDERGTPRPMLNGKPIMLPGALDQGFWPDGIYTAPTDAALRFDIEAAKQLGLVAIRKHIKIEPERYYYWADKLGLLIIQDMPSGRDGDPFTDLPTSPEASTVCEMERRLLIQQRWNHPSIIAWALFNEGWGQHDTLRQVRWAKELDPTRLIDEASGFPRHGGGDIHDTHGGDAPQDGRRICIDSETAGFGLAAVGHSWPGKLWATGTYDPKTGGESASKELYPVDEASKNWYTRRMRGFYRGMWAKRETTGSSGDFKVQLYDVETESNGLLSYDRAVWKVDPAVVARACRGETLAADTVDVVPCALTRQITWRWTTQRPADAWNAAGFDDRDWREGKAGFGTPTGSTKLGTPWTTADIWLRHEITLDAKPVAPLLRILHDEDVEVFINGVPAVQEGGFTTTYDDYEIDPKAAATLKPGRNLIAVHCHQTIGGQFIDVGIVQRAKQ